jgi:hypothetical protein
MSTNEQSAIAPGNALKLIEVQNVHAQDRQAKTTGRRMAATGQI